MIRFASSQFCLVELTSVSRSDPCPDCCRATFREPLLAVATISGTPVQVVYGVREERNGITGDQQVAWLRRTTRPHRGGHRIPSDSGQRIIRELAMADDGAVVALVEVEDDSGVTRTNVLMVFDPSGKQLWRRDIGPASPTVRSAPATCSSAQRHPSITIDGRTEGGCSSPRSIAKICCRVVAADPIARRGAQLHTVLILRAP
jgi:hypothetical protein